LSAFINRTELPVLLGHMLQSQLQDARY
jgi:hypothetical protein